MLNSEKFKSAEERRAAYENYCEECGKKHMALTDEFGWLDLEYKEVVKSCPFCGGEAILYKAWIPYVRCDKCGTQTTAYQTPDDAIAAWNRRVK